MTKHLNVLAAATLMAVISTTAQAEPYTIMIFEPAHVLKDRLQKTATAQAYWAAYTRYASQLMSENALRGGAALAAAPDTPGQAGEAIISGYFQIDVQDDAAAKRLAERVPLAAGGRVEVRKDLPNPTMVQN